MGTDNHISVGKGSSSGRVEWIDCAKGIGIILVIIGHTVINDEQLMHQIVRGGIFSFHMPLFFILSALTFKLSENNDQFVRNVEKAFKHLIFPLLAAYGVLVIIDYLRRFDGLNLRGFIVEKVNALIFSSGVNVGIFGATVPALGMLWFIVALFLSRILFDYLSLKIHNSNYEMTLVIILTCVGVLMSGIQWLPGCFDIVLAIMFFIWIGYRMQSVDFQKHRFVIGIASTLIWGSTLIITYLVKYSYMEIAVRRYPLFPLCYITAIAGAIGIFCISGWMTDSFRCKALQWLGKNSMVLYCIHVIESTFPWWYCITKSDVINIIVRLFVIIFVALIVVNIRKSVFTRKSHDNAS